MNTYFQAARLVNRFTAGSLTAFLVFASILPVLAMPNVAQAAGLYSIPSGSVSFSVSGTVLTISGTSSASPQTGNNNTQDMSVVWNYNSTKQCSQQNWQEADYNNGVNDFFTFSPNFANGGFTGTWSAKHDFTVSGSYDIKMVVNHGSECGNDGSDAATFSTTIVIPPTHGGLVVEKVVVQNGLGTTATSSFSFQVDGGSATAFEADGSNNLTLAAGLHTVNEIPNVHYTSAFSGSCNSSGEVTVPAGATTTACVITNTFTNTAPVVQNLSIVTDEDVASSTVLVGSDADLDSFLFALLSNPNPLTGLLSGFVPATGAITFTPTVNFNGSDSFTYTANDIYSVSNTGTVTITVNPVNDAPVANDDSASTNEDTPVTTGNVLTNDTDIDVGDVLSVSTSDTASANGGVVVNNNDGTFLYTPALNFSGFDTFNYTVTDINGATDTAVVTINVSSANDGPVAVGDSYSTDEDTTLTVNATGVLGNDSDSDSSITAVLDVNASNGDVTLNADGSFTYVPDVDYNGTDSFTYHATDGSADSSVITVTITVRPTNDAPVANDDTLSTSHNTAVGDVLGASDIDADTLTYATTTSPVSGSISLFDSATGAFTYTPNTGFSGADSFQFKANDGSLDSNTATISITVGAPQAILGCTNSTATNFNSSATQDDGSCQFPSSGGNGSGRREPPSNGGEVLGATSEVLGESCGLYMDKFIRSGRVNNVEQVKKLQGFLNKWMNSGLPVTGFYGPMTLSAVNGFQTKYAAEVLTPWNLSHPTGIVYQTTLRWINKLECPDLMIDVPALIDWSKNPNLSV